MFDCGFDNSLMFGAVVAAASRLDFVPTVEIAAKSGYIFVVNDFVFVLAKQAFSFVTDHYFPYN